MSRNAVKRSAAFNPRSSEGRKRSSRGNEGNAELAALMPVLVLLLTRSGNSTSSKETGKVSFGRWPQLLVMLVLPLVIRLLLPSFQHWLSQLKLCRSRAIRYIKHSRECRRVWVEDERSEEAFNATLQRAVLAFINTHMPHVARGWKQSNVQGQREERPLDGVTEATVTQAGSVNKRNTPGLRLGRLGRQRSPGGVRGGPAPAPPATYSHHSVLCNPPNGVWVDLGNGIELQRCINRIQSKEPSRNTTIITTTLALRSTSPAIKPANINAFVDRCLDAFNHEQRSRMDMSRYLFTPVLPGTAAPDDKARQQVLYRRYKLSDARTFASFFHPDKEAVLALVDQFTAKRGKFSVPGYPHKLGFLLHGPPGTGKTSFIKALAHHTRRHIMSVPLSKIRTNQELMDIMLGQCVCVAGVEEGAPTALPFNKVMFVMEDVDAASGVMLRRGIKAARAASASASAASAHGVLATDSSSLTHKRVQGGVSHSSYAVHGAAGEESVGCAGCGGDDDSATSALDAAPFSWRSLLKEPALTEDKLNLSGLLNVLDGVIDTPNRIVILTTNHPEKLDPALVRPGRVNRQIFMGNAQLSRALAMIRHFYNSGLPLDAEQERRMADVFVDGALSPAQLESMCMENESMETLLSCLEADMVRWRR